MRAKASTYGSINRALLIFGLALTISSGDSVALIVLGALAALAGVAGFVAGVMLHLRAARTVRRV